MNKLYLLAISVLASASLVAQSLPAEYRITADGRKLIIGDQANTGLYDQSLVRSIYLTFPQTNYWSLMINNYASQTDIPATMIVDGIVYDSVGVRFKGQTSYSMTTSSQKKSFNISTDYIHDNQKIMGYKTLNLNNCFGDRSFLREVFFEHSIKKYVPVAKSAYVKLYINGENWGVYPHVQQMNGDYLKEWFMSKNGTLWRADRPPGSTGPGGAWGDGTAALNYLGADTSLYKPYYTLKSTNKLQPWNDLVTTARELNTTPLANLKDTLENYLDIDRTLWFLAAENLFSDDDGYIHKGKMDYYAYWEVETGRMVPLEYDANSVMTTSAATWSPFYNETKVNYPLMNKIFAVPELRQRYIAHLKTMVSEVYNSAIANAKLDAYYAQIDTMVQNDTKKLYTYAQFQSEKQVLKNFINSRRNSIMNHSEFTQVAPVISNAEYKANGMAWTAPAAGQTAQVTANVTSGTGISKVNLYFSNAIVGTFSRTQMYDDGLHNDGVAGDGIFGADIPGFAAGTYVRWYIEAAANNTAKTASYEPVGAEHDVYIYIVTPLVAAGSDVVINEIMASNSTSVQDNAGEYDDWIELYNKSGNALDISGYYLTDNMLNLNKWEIPVGTILAPNGYQIIWADEDSSQGPYHANFKLSASGETLFLLDPSGMLMDSLSWGTQISDMGFARVPNGTGNFMIQQHTYNGNNNLTAIEPIYAASSMFVYPNPANDQIKIKYHGEQGKDVFIYNAVGQEMTHLFAQNEMEINTSSYPAGVYFIRSGTLSTKLVIRK